MKNCSSCGRQISDEAMFCPGCGAQQADPAATPAPVTTPVNVQEPVSADEDVQRNRGIAWLAYMGPLLLVPLFARKRSPYCQFHVKQGATLLAVWIAYQIVQSITLAITRAILPGELKYSMITGYYYAPSALTVIFTIIFTCGAIFLGVLAVMGIVNAATGKTKKLILIGEIPFVEMLMDKIYAALNK